MKLLELNESLGGYETIKERSIVVDNSLIFTSYIENKNMLIEIYTISTKIDGSEKIADSKNNRRNSIIKETIIKKCKISDSCPQWQQKIVKKWKEKEFGISELPDSTIIITSGAFKGFEGTIIDGMFFVEIFGKRTQLKAIPEYILDEKEIILDEKILEIYSNKDEKFVINNTEITHFYKSYPAEVIGFLKIEDLKQTNDVILDICKKIANDYYENC